MPRDATETRERLLREAERLFARRGLYQTTVREITQAAGQRNVSALNYHFGSREGVLDAILVRHGDVTDDGRRELLETFGDDPSTRELLSALVIPYAAHLGTAEGRDYLRIVAQMTGFFATWDIPRAGTGPWLIQILGRLTERPPGLPVAIRQERIVAMIMLMTAAMAERARAIEEGQPLALDEPTFVGNLTDMLAGVLEAPLHAPVRR